MTEDKSQEAQVEAESTEEAEAEVERIEVAKGEYEKLQQTLGSLKRELKDLKKTKDTDTQELSQKKDEEFGLLQEALLRAAGITDQEEKELARKIQQQSGMPWNELVDDDYFNSKLKEHRNVRANSFATEGLESSSGDAAAKSKPEYWIAKGTPPSVNQVPNRKVRAKIARAFLENAKHGKTFYND